MLAKGSSPSPIAVPEPEGRSASMDEQQQHHVVAVALPYQGHLNALMRVCKLLVQLHEGLVVSFVDMDLFHNRVQEVRISAADAPAHAAGDGKDQALLRIKRVHFPIDMGLELSKDFQFSIRPLMEAILLIAPDLLRLIHSLQPPVTWLLSDFSITRLTQDVADQLAVPCVVLYPFCASRLLLQHYITQGDLVSMDEVAKTFATSSTRKAVFCKELPGLPTLFNVDIPHFKHVQDDSLYMLNHAVESWRISNNRAHSILVNSFNELEASAFAALSKCSQVPIYGIGPWIETLGKECATNLWKEDEACIPWLDQQPASSVLYVSFGSIAVFSQAQFEEICDGLLASKQRFLWALRRDLVEDATCSLSTIDIMSKSSGRGFIVDWAPQLKVLGHPSVGGFLTHCGWNSIVESIANGVPMLCWPYFADQPLNARCIVDEWKLGLEFEASKGTHSFVKKDEIERAIKCLMEGMKGEVVRQNVKMLKKACVECLLPNGSSYKNLKALIRSLGQ